MMLKYIKIDGKYVSDIKIAVPADKKVDGVVEVDGKYAAKLEPFITTDDPTKACRISGSEDAEGYAKYLQACEGVEGRRIEVCGDNTHAHDCFASTAASYVRGAT